MLNRVFTIPLASLISTVAIQIQPSFVLAQQMKPTVTPLLLSQVRIYTETHNYNNYTQVIRADSGPDDRGRWRFYRPDNVSRSEMQAQGCIDVRVSGASWRCPRPVIKVGVNDGRPYDNGRYDDGRPYDNGQYDDGRPYDNGQYDDGRPYDNGRYDDGRPYDNGRYDNGGNTRRLRAESGPDDRGRWRFYRPDNVSRSEMQSQGCTDVNTSGPAWRCPYSVISVFVDGRR